MNDFSNKIDRRKFLELTSVLSGSSVVASSMPWLSIFSDSGIAPGGLSDRVRIGLIGVGIRGHMLGLNVLDIAERLNVEIVAVCDNYEPHYKRAIELTNGEAEAFYDYRKMLEMDDLDGVIIATPLYEHAQMTVDALQAGVHVFCEKSMARTIDDVKRMYDTHLETDNILLIGHQRLFSPIYLKAMERIKSGHIGPVTMMKGNWHRNRDWILYDVPGGRGTELDRRLNWRLYEELSGGMITELGAHHFQIANWVIDSQPKSVFGTGSINFWKDGREVYDNFSLVFKYPGGINFNYDCLSSNKHNGMQFQVLGNEGTMELESNKFYMENPPQSPAIRSLIHSIEQNLFETIPIGGATWVPEQAVTNGGEFISDEWGVDDGTQLLLEAFIEYIRKGSAPEKLTKQGYYASLWALLALEATKSDSEIKLPQEYSI